MIKTVNLTTAVTAIDVTGKQNVTIKNIGNNTAYVSASPDIFAGGDDCLSVAAGEIVTLEGVATLKKVNGQFGVHGTVYALASGATTIELIPTNTVNFKSAAVDYSRDIADISSLIPTAASAGNQLTDKAYVDSELLGKVDKADGMGLSSNDYTTADKQKLAALTNYDDSTVNSAIADLQAGKADKSDTYTKTETDTKITEKVAEIVADAPEDFDTLKEMSDWISKHETSAASMNSAIQTNASNISSLQAGKVDKETGKSLVPDSEIARLATLGNYDDTSIKADISSLQSNKVDKETGKSLISDSEIARLATVSNYDDTAVKSDIAGIQSVIPAAASPDNQLADKAYVDNSAYTLPTATADTLGGVKIGEGLSISDGVLSASDGGNITYGTEDLTEGVSPLADGTIYYAYDDVANKIYSGYMGINGVAVKIYGDTSTVAMSVDKVAVSENLSRARYGLAATTVGNYALFGGGYDGSSTRTTVDAYSSTLVKSTGTSLSEARYELAATTVGNYALFGGGTPGPSTVTYSSVVDTYSSTLVKSTATDLIRARKQLAATTVGNYALFGGGHYYKSNSSNGDDSTVDAYSSTLVRTTASSLSEARSQLAATTVGNYALFGGSSVDAYSTTLVKTATTTTLSVSRKQLAATTVGNYALFGGGSLNGQAVGTVDVFSENLVKFTASSLSTVRYNLAATTVGNYALFGGGSIEFYSGSNRRYSYTAIVDVYSASLVKSVATDLSEIKDSLAATTVGNYALFGGGVNSAAIASVDAYTVTRTYN